MTNRYYYYLLIPVFAFAIVVATGFWYVNRGIGNGNNGSLTDDSPQPYIYEPKVKDPDSYEVKMERLSNSVKRFREAKTFNAVIDELKSGGLHSELSYVKPLRLKASISVDKKPAFEMIIVGETSYAKFTDGDWKMTNDEDIRAFGRSFFEGMITSDTSLQSFGVDPDTHFDIKNNAKDDCTQFDAMYKSGESEFPISFCIDEKDNLIKLSKTDIDGEVVTRYKDYNSLFNIERPVLPVLDPTLQIQYIDSEETL
ncbi:MAG: hypothetical protein P1P90_05255 [Patescibacteria group bacterium]|nr:hypothetical protein [Patescibacteria group bacterium]